MPPPLPPNRSSGPPPLPGTRGVSPVSPPPRSGIANQFDLNQGSQRVSTRGVNRATGNSEGVWFSFNSTNVNRAMVQPQYDLDGNKTGVGTITVEFVSGATYTYEDRPMGDWYDIISSSSKGRHGYYVIRGPGAPIPGKSNWPFTKIKDAWRTKEQIKAIIDAREPTTKRHKKRFFQIGGKTHGIHGMRARTRGKPGIS